MGCNYFAELSDGERLHIGKSSAGWCFALRVVPERGLDTLDEWAHFLDLTRATIRAGSNDDAPTITLDELCDTITNRQWIGLVDRSPQWLEENSAEPGPRGLVRHRIRPGHCIGHGAGTWDFLVGEFS